MLSSCVLGLIPRIFYLMNARCTGWSSCFHVYSDLVDAIFGALLRLLLLSCYLCSNAKSVLSDGVAYKVLVVVFAFVLVMASVVRMVVVVVLGMLASALPSADSGAVQWWCCVPFLLYFSLAIGVDFI